MIWRLLMLLGTVGNVWALLPQAQHDCTISYAFHAVFVVVFGVNLIVAAVVRGIADAVANGDIDL